MSKLVCHGTVGSEQVKAAVCPGVRGFSLLGAQFVFLFTRSTIQEVNCKVGTVERDLMYCEVSTKAGFQDPIRDVTMLISHSSSAKFVNSFYHVVDVDRSHSVSFTFALSFLDHMMLMLAKWSQK